MIKICTFTALLLSCISHSQTNTEVFLFDLNLQNGTIQLSNFKNISNNEEYDNQPSFWDNNTILFASTRNGQIDILKYTITDGNKDWLSDTEGSEYSPLKIPGQNAVSAIRLDVDGQQLLYRYDLKSKTSKPIMNTLVVGYHTWFDKHTIVSSVLENDFMSLYVTNITSNANRKIEANVGRSLHRIPNSQLISFISKESNDNWQIKSYDPTSGKTKSIATTLPNSEDMCWLSDGRILMGKQNTLFQLNPKIDTLWKEAVSLNDYGVTNITRIAVSPDGTKLAVVGEDIYQKLAPTLENIKWIAGNWKGEAFGGQTEENWSAPSAGSMMATFKLINDGKVSFYEIEIIRELENTLILQLKHFDNDLKGWETKDETVDFPLKEITPVKVAFQGMTFEKVSENEMNVYVDIHQNDGSIETVKFNYKK